MRSSRSYKSPVSHWWWSIDRTLFGIIALLMFLGAFVVTTSSGAVASEYGVGAFYFAKKQWMFLCLSFAVMVGASTLSLKQIKVIGGGLFIGALIGIVLTLFMRIDVKGASRWIEIFGFKVQPTEFMKLGVVITTAILLSSKKDQIRNSRFLISLALMGVLELGIILQPDFGMFGLLGIIWGAQVFMAGIPLFWLMGLASAGIGAVAGAYTFLPHVRSRVSRFLDPESGDSYQVDRAMEAIVSGGWTGIGAGEGIVKQHLPDAHTDFIFAVIAEEFGLIGCFVLLFIYGALIFTGFNRLLDQKDRFIFLVGVGIVILFALQVLINIAVVLQLIPTTGMTLPFISYGGSSTLTMGLAMGILLALTRKGVK